MGFCSAEGGGRSSLLLEPLRCDGPSTHLPSSFPHHESRVGDRYNAVVPDFDEAVAKEVQGGSEDAIASGLDRGRI